MNVLVFGHGGRVKNDSLVVFIKVFKESTPLLEYQQVSII